MTKLPNAIRYIWYTRNNELPELPRVGWSWQQQTDPDEWLMQEFARTLVAATPLTPFEEHVIGLCVLQGYTLKEAGETICTTGVRAGQILDKGLRKLRRRMRLLTGTNRYESLYGERE
jgi:DNA-directed RNA polymerase specialized sigma24 family protein